MYTIAATFDVNPPGEKAVISREQMWKGLVQKAEYAVPFVPAMDDCQIIERFADGFIREIHLRGTVMRERIVFAPDVQVHFTRIDPADGGWIANIMSEADRGLLLTIGYLMDRFRATRLIPLYYIGVSAALVALGRVNVESTIFVAILIFWSFSQTGGQAGLNTLITQIYPPRMRSTALGWAGGAGRIGGVISPVFGGIAIAQHLSLQLTLACAAIPPLVVAVLVRLLERTEYIRMREAQGGEGQ